jgi:hypothetical protein
MFAFPETRDQQVKLDFYLLDSEVGFFVSSLVREKKMYEQLCVCFEQVQITYVLYLFGLFILCFFVF